VAPPGESSHCKYYHFGIEVNNYCIILLCCSNEKEAVCSGKNSYCKKPEILVCENVGSTIF
jgi:hypothetical protein